MERNFKYEENQKLWDEFYNSRIAAWEDENKEKLENSTYTEEERGKAQKQVFNHLRGNSVTPYNIERAKMRSNISQYKPVTIRFEECIDKPFSQVTREEYVSFTGNKEICKKPAMLNSFFLDSVQYERMVASKEFIIELLPELYRGIGIVLCK